MYFFKIINNNLIPFQKKFKQPGIGGIHFVSCKLQVLFLWTIVGVFIQIRRTDFKSANISVSCYSLALRAPSSSQWQMHCILVNEGHHLAEGLPRLVFFCQCSHLLHLNQWLSIFLSSRIFLYTIKGLGILINASKTPAAPACLTS